MAFGAKKVEVSPYDDLENAYKELRAHRALHKRIFDKEAELREKCEIVENQLKISLRVQYAGQPSGEYKAYVGSIVNVVVQSKWNREVDAVALCELVPDAMERGLVSYSVDLKMLDSILEGATEDYKRAFEQVIKRVPGTAAVSYKLSKE